MNKIFIDKIVFIKFSNTPITYKQFKEIKLHDDDVFEFGFAKEKQYSDSVEPAHYFGQITRKTLETDKELERRKKRIEQIILWENNRKKLKNK